MQQGHVAGKLQRLRAVPAGFVEHDHRVVSGLHFRGDHFQVDVHLAGVGLLADVADGAGVVGAAGGEQVPVSVAVVPDRAGAYAAGRPDARVRAFPARPQLVLEPDLDLWRLGAFAGFLPVLPARRVQRQPAEIVAESLCRSRSAFGWTGRTVWWLKPRACSVRCIAARLTETPNRAVAQATRSFRR